MALTTTGSPFSLNIPSASSDLADLFGSYLVPNMSALNTYAAHKGTAQTFSALQTFTAGINVTSGNVGIGTATPGALFDVYGGNIRADGGGANNLVLRDGSIENHKVASDAGGVVVNYAGYNSGTTYYRNFVVCSGKYNEIAFFQGSTGRLGLGTSSPSYALHLNTDSAAKPTSNTWTISSDARVKEVIGSYTRGVADIVALEPKRYRLNGAFGSVDDGRVHVSVIAQETQATWPEMVGTYEHREKDEDGVETVMELLNLNTNELQWALVNAIKELAQRVESLER